MENSIAVNPRSGDVKPMRAFAPRQWSRNTALGTKIEQKQTFDAQSFLRAANVVKKVVEYGNNVAVFTQGDPARSIFYIQKGGVMLAVVNEAGKEAVTAILGPGDFFGDGCLSGQLQRVRTAVTISCSTVLVIEKQDMIRLLHAESAFSDLFIKLSLSRRMLFEENLIDQLFNSVEKRLARTLLLLANYGEQDKPRKMTPRISQEMLAEMIGTTRSRVNSLMNKFRKLNLITYGSTLRGLQINKPLLSAILHDS
jgi:CRP/FNR family transcriptional regulator, cyclic AMP receptor protein